MKTWPLLLAALCFAGASPAADHAVALIYHHVDRGSPPSTSVTPGTFDGHLDYLARHGFTVWPLGRVLAALRAGESLPQKTVSITFDDAYDSIYREALPRLRRHGWAATLFVNSEAVDRGYGGIMSWAQIRELAAAGFEIGNHSHTHDHLVRRRDGESENAWRRRVGADIERAQARLAEELGIETNLFAYPYGEYSPELKQVVAALGLTGIAQQSGAIGPDSDFLALPRFPMSTGYADIERFALAVRARPLPLRAKRAGRGEAPEGALATLRLEFGPGEYRGEQLACYASTGERLGLERLAGDGLRIRVEPPAAQRPGRNKINCTAPSSNRNGVYFWYSYQWLVKNPDGTWYRE